MDRGTKLGTCSLIYIFFLVVPVIAGESPESPDDLHLKQLPPDAILLGWNDNSDNEEGFRIERKIGSAGPWIVIANLPPNTEGYTDSGLSCGTGDPFAYLIYAFNSMGESESNEAGTLLSCSLCEAIGDEDDDGVCDDEDLCMGFDDTVDTDGDGIPDGCEGAPGSLIAPWTTGVNSATLETEFTELLSRFYMPVEGAPEEAAHVTKLVTVGEEDLQLPPWYKFSHTCSEGTLHNLDGTFPSPSYHRYLVNADELSELAIITAYGSNEQWMLDIHRTVQRLHSLGDHPGLPCWLARVCVPPEDCSTPPWDGPALQCVFGDSASDATARFGLAYYIAARNSSFSVEARNAFQQAADALALKHLDSEYFNFPGEDCEDCPVGRFSSQAIRNWVGGGANTVGSFSGLVMWIGYYQDILRFLIAAGTSTGNPLFFERAEQVVEQFLMATESDAANLRVGHFNFRWDVDAAAGPCASHALLPAPCNESTYDDPPRDDGVTDFFWKEGRAWDTIDAPRALWVGDTLRAISIATGEPLAGIYVDLLNWVEGLQEQMTLFAEEGESCVDWSHDTSQAPTLCAGGHYANGLGMGLFTYANTNGAAKRLFEALSHYHPPTGTWDAQACLGVYHGVRTVKALAVAIGLDVDLYEPCMPDSDEDGVCDLLDLCPGFDDALDGDADGVADGCDVCPGFDDHQDSDGDGVPDGCDFVPVQEIPHFRTSNQTGCHTQGIYPATRRIQNQSTESGLSVDVCPGTTTVFRAPLVILNPGFRVQTGGTFVAGNPAFPVHVAVLDPGASDFDTEDEVVALIDTLNQYFRSEFSEELIDFRLGSFTTWQAIDAADMESGGTNEDPCVDYVQTSGDAFSSSVFTTLFGDGDGTSCSTGPTVIRDPNMLNVYIYDISNNNGRGRRNSGHPWIILDIDRINDPDPLNRQSPETHEMGHAFGCDHVCDDDVEQIADDSNPMASKDLCDSGVCSDTFMGPFSGGNRLEGFAHDPFPECVPVGCSGPICQTYQNASQPRIGQTQLILWYAEEFARNFGLPLSWSSALPIRLPCGETTCSIFPP